MASLSVTPSGMSPGSASATTAALNAETTRAQTAEAAISALASSNATLAVNTLGNLAAGVTNISFAGQSSTLVTATLTGNVNLVVSGLPAPGWAKLLLLQDGTGGRTVTITVGSNSTGVFVEPDPAQWSTIWLWTADGNSLQIEGPSLVGRSFLVTSTNAAWPIQSPITVVDIVAVGGGGGGGGGGSSANATLQGGAAGGGPGWPTLALSVDVSAISTLNITCGSGGTAGAGAAAGGVVGGQGGYGGNTTVVAGGTTYTGRGGFKGLGSNATSATQGLIVYSNTGGAGITGGPNLGGIGGGDGCNPSGLGGVGGGGGGAAASATNGGNGGSAGKATLAGAAGSGTTGTVNGGNGATATDPGAGGGGGGGGANATGTGGAGGAGAPGYALIVVRGAGSVTLPLPNAGTRLFNAQVASSSGTQVTGFPGSPSLAPWQLLQAGGVLFQNANSPANDGPTHNRLWLMAPFGPWAAKTNKIHRTRTYVGDTNNKSGGAQTVPAAGWATPTILGNYATNPLSNWHVFHGFSYMFPDGTQRDDLAFPLIPAGSGAFFQLFEDFGQPFTTSPLWALSALQGNVYPIAQLGATTPGVNYLYIPSNSSPRFPAIWVSPSPIINGDANKYDIIFEVGRSTAASTDNGVTGGFLRMWLNGVAQVFAPGAAEGGDSGANWTRANAGQTLIMATLNNGDSGPGYANHDNYWHGGTMFSSGAGFGPNPITTYRYIVGIDTTKNGADPALN